MKADIRANRIAMLDAEEASLRARLLTICPVLPLKVVSCF
jgi:hypothetical protein